MAVTLAHGQRFHRFPQELCRCGYGSKGCFKWLSVVHGQSFFSWSIRSHFPAFVKQLVQLQQLLARWWHGWHCCLLVREWGIAGGLNSDLKLGGQSRTKGAMRIYNFDNKDRIMYINSIRVTIIVYMILLYNYYNIAHKGYYTILSDEHTNFNDNSWNVGLRCLISADPCPVWWKPNLSADPSAIDIDGHCMPLPLPTNQQNPSKSYNITCRHALKIVQTAVKGLTMDEGCGNWFHLSEVHLHDDLRSNGSWLRERSRLGAVPDQSETLPCSWNNIQRESQLDYEFQWHKWNPPGMLRSPWNPDRWKASVRT